MKLFLISDNADTLTGMRLTGVEGTLVHEAHEVLSALQAACEDPEIAVLLITGKLMELCREEIYAQKLRSSHPLIVEVADRHGGSGVSDSITQYVKQAVGIDI